MPNSPQSVTIHMYDVGFGDCFLLSFAYAGNDTRSVLIDCGSSSQLKAHMQEVVKQIQIDCGGKLDALVVTHRHSDHLSAFGLKGVGDTLESLNPDVIVQPWTEHPDAKGAAVEAPSVFSLNAVNYLNSLDSAQELAWAVCEHSQKMLPAAGDKDRRILSQIAQLNIANKAAVSRLYRMGGRQGAQRAYVHAGSKSGLEPILPGVNVTVLGPPTLKQAENVRTQTSWNEAEFWKLQGRLAANTATNTTGRIGKSVLFPNAKAVSVDNAASYVRWIVRKADRAQLLEVRSIITSLNDALNNTSVNLLFEIGNFAMLFPGDTQWESWEYALSKSSWRKKLQKVQVYKVGHHGSTNATPKSLWRTFKDGGMVPANTLSLLSTKRGKHSGVPRPSLVSALKKETDFNTTESYKQAKVVVRSWIYEF